MPTRKLDLGMPPIKGSQLLERPITPLIPETDEQQPTTPTPDETQFNLDTFAEQVYDIRERLGRDPEELKQIPLEDLKAFDKVTTEFLKSYSGLVKYKQSRRKQIAAKVEADVAALGPIGFGAELEAMDERGEIPAWQKPLLVGYQLGGGMMRGLSSIVGGVTRAAGMVTGSEGIENAGRQIIESNKKLFPSVYEGADFDIKSFPGRGVESVGEMMPYIKTLGIVGAIPKTVGVTSALAGASAKVAFMTATKIPGLYDKMEAEGQEPSMARAAAIAGAQSILFVTAVGYFQNLGHSPEAAIKFGRQLAESEGVNLIALIGKNAAIQGAKTGIAFATSGAGSDFIEQMGIKGPAKYEFTETLKAGATEGMAGFLTGAMFTLADTKNLLARRVETKEQMAREKQAQEEAWARYNETLKTGVKVERTKTSFIVKEILSQYDSPKDRIAAIRDRIETADGDEKLQLKSVLEQWLKASSKTAAPHTEADKIIDKISKAKDPNTIVTELKKAIVSAQDPATKQDLTERLSAFNRRQAEFKGMFELAQAEAHAKKLPMVPPGERIQPFPPGSTEALQGIMDQAGVAPAPTAASALLPAPVSEDVSQQIDALLPGEEPIKEISDAIQEPSPKAMGAQPVREEGVEERERVGQEIEGEKVAGEGIIQIKQKLVRLRAEQKQKPTEGRAKAIANLEKRLAVGQEARTQRDIEIKDTQQIIDDISDEKITADRAFELIDQAPKDKVNQAAAENMKKSIRAGLGIEEKPTISTEESLNKVNRAAKIIADKLGRPGDTAAANMDIAKRISDAVERKDADELSSMIARVPGENESWKAAFEFLSGEKLPKGRNNIMAFLDRWAGISPEERSSINKRKEDDRLRVRKDRDDERVIATAEQRKVLGGISLKQFIDDLIERGFTKLHDTGLPGKNKWQLRNVLSKQYIKLDRLFLDYAKIAVAKAEAKPTPKPDGYFKGDAYRLTGETSIIDGAEFNQVEMLEGKDKGKIKTVLSEKAKAEQAAQKQKEFQESQDGFRRLREDAEPPKTPLYTIEPDKGRTGWIILDPEGKEFSWSNNKEALERRIAQKNAELDKAATGKMPKFSPAQAIKSVADSIKQLRAVDIVRLMDENPDHREELANYIKKNHANNQRILDALRKAMEPDDALALGPEEKRAAKNTAALEDKHRLKKPIKGPSGAELVGYQWVSTVEDGMYGKRKVSDWSESQTSVPTGRSIVHLFWVRTLDGQETLMGVGAAKNALGLADDRRLYKIAKQEQESQRYTKDRWDKESALYEEKAATTIKDANQRFRSVNNPDKMMWGTREQHIAKAEELFNDALLLTKGGKWIRIWNKDTIAELKSRGWDEQEPAPADIFIEEVKKDDKQIGTPGNVNIPNLSTALVPTVKGWLTADKPATNPDLKKAIKELGVNTDDPLYNHKITQEAVEGAIVKTIREMGIENDFPALVKLYQNQPVLGVRTGASLTQQAYSTPVPLVSAITNALNLPSRKLSIYEPTAGNGLLLSGLPESDGTSHTYLLNEIDTTRDAMLKSLFPQADITNSDATTFSPKKQVDVVLTNPPFGTLPKVVTVKTSGAMERDIPIRKLEHLIAWKALESMKDDGAAVLIMGAQKEEEITGTNAAFLKALYNQYNITGHFEVSGDLYKRQGAAWPVMVITIHGRKSFPVQLQPTPTQVRRLDNWNDIEGITDEIKQNVLRDGRGIGIRVPGGPAANRIPSKKPDRAPTKPSDLPMEGRPERRPETDTIVRGDRPTRPQPEGGRPIGAGRTEIRPQRDPEITPGAAPEGSIRAPQPGADRAVAASRPDPSDKEQGIVLQNKYEPVSGGRSIGALVPINLQNPIRAALENILDRIEENSLDEYVAHELGFKSAKDMVSPDGNPILSAEQVDALAEAFQAFHDSSGAICADQTGTGKGRVAASCVEWGVRHGKIPVFVTEKANLFSDIYRDLKAIGSNDLKPLIFNSDNGRMIDEDGNVIYKHDPQEFNRAIKKMEKGDFSDFKGDNPKYNFVAMTYSQVNKEVSPKLEALLKAPRGSLLAILDESHNAAGVMKSTGEASNQGNNIARLLQPGQTSGVIYLSATWAKNPEMMGIYSRAFASAGQTLDEIMTAFQKGGVAMQEMMVASMAARGRYIRREQSFAGTKFVIESTPPNTKQAKLEGDRAEKAMEIVRDITALDELFADAMESISPALIPGVPESFFAGAAAGGKVSESVNLPGSPFSQVHNYISSFLASLKAEKAATEAIAAIKKGQKPFILVENTMESHIQALKDVGLAKEGDPFGGTFVDVLDLILEKITWTTVTDPLNEKNTIKVKIPLELFPPELQRLFKGLRNKIKGVSLPDMPFTPIDYVKHKIAEAGYSCCEITGRNLYLDYSETVQGEPTLKRMPNINRHEEIMKFNSGGYDAMIANVAGATGMSIHPSRDFADQRQRVTLILQAFLDISKFIQALGRTHRVGAITDAKDVTSHIEGKPEVFGPAVYKFLQSSLGMEIRPGIRLENKMKSLNAQTSSNIKGHHKVADVDMINKYGARVIQDWLDGRPDTARKIGMEDSGEGGEAFANKVAGRLGILPQAIQNEFWDENQRSYRELIDKLNAEGKNDLIVTSHAEANATTKDRLLVYGEPGSSDAPPVYLEKLEMTISGKPTSFEAARNSLSSPLGASEFLERDKEFDKFLEVVELHNEAGREHGQTPIDIDRVKAYRDTIKRRIKELKPGSMVLGRKGEIGIITGVGFAGIPSGYNANPYAPGLITIKMATPGTTGHAIISLAGFMKDGMNVVGNVTSGSAPAYFLNSYQEEYAANQTQRKEFEMLTGDMIRAASMLGDSDAKAVHFGRDDGTFDFGWLNEQSSPLALRMPPSPLTSDEIRNHTPATVKSSDATESFWAWNHSPTKNTFDMQVRKTGKFGKELLADKRLQAIAAPTPQSPGFVEEKIGNRKFYVVKDLPSNKFVDAVLIVNELLRGKNAYLINPDQPSVDLRETAKRKIAEKPSPTSKGTKLYSVEQFVAEKTAEYGAKAVRAGWDFFSRGAQRFAEWAKAMLKKLGRGVSKFLRRMFADLQRVWKSRRGAVGGFRLHSEMENVLKKPGMLPKKAPPKQMIEAIKKHVGKFKSVELQESGLIPFLEKMTQPATRQDVIDYLDMNKIQIEEKILANKWIIMRTDESTEYFNSKAEAQAVIDEENEWIDNEAATIEITDDEIISVDHNGEVLYQAYHDEDGWYEDGFYNERIDLDYKRDAIEAAEKASERARNYYREILSREPTKADEEGAARFSEYQEPGGTNYREILLKLPAESRDKRSQQFKSSHWPSEINVLLHLRLNDRIIDGKKVLFIEEVQSDWHQKAREIRNKEVKRVMEADGLTKAEAEKQVPVDYGYYAGVPDAPFKPTDRWAMLGMKRVIQEAIDNGYDRVTWTSGDMQAERYDLSKRISRVEYHYNEKFPQDGGLMAYDLEGRQVIKEGGISKSQLEDYIGKDAAKKLIENEKDNGDGTRSAEISGLDLKVGGEGMKGFYDKILPAAVQEYIKKFGGRVRTTPMTSVEIEPEAKKLREVLSDHGYDPDTVEIQQIFSENNEKRPSWLTEEQLDQIEAGYHLADAHGVAKKTVWSFDITPAMKQEIPRGQPLYTAEYLVAKHGAKAFKKGYETFKKGAQTFKEWLKGMLKAGVKMAMDAFKKMFQDIQRHWNLFKRRGGFSLKDRIEKMTGVTADELQAYSEREALRRGYELQSKAARLAHSKAVRSWKAKIDRVKTKAFKISDMRKMLFDFAQMAIPANKRYGINSAIGKSTQPAQFRNIADRIVGDAELLYRKQETERFNRLISETEKLHSSLARDKAEIIDGIRTRGKNGQYSQAAKLMRKFMQALDNDGSINVPPWLTEGLDIALESESPEDLNPAELENINDSLQFILNAQRLINQVIRKGQVRDASEVSNAIQDHLSQTPEIQVKAILGKEVTPRIGWFDLFHPASRKLQDAYNFSELFGPKGQEYFYDAMVDAELDSIAIRKHGITTLNETCKSIGYDNHESGGFKKWLDEVVDTVTTSAGEKRGLNRGERIELVLACEDPSTLPLLEAQGWRLHRDKSMNPVIIPELWSWAQKVRSSWSLKESELADNIRKELNVHIRPQVDKVHERLNGWPLVGDQGHYKYWPRRVDTVGEGRAMTDAQLAQFGGYHAATIGGEHFGFLKERVEHRRPIVINNAVSTYMRALDESGVYVGFAEPLRNVALIARQPGFQRTVIKHMGEESYTRLINRSVLMSRQSDGVETALDSMTRKALRNLAGALLTPSSFMKQIASVGAAATEIPIKYLLLAAEDGWQNKVFHRMIDKSLLAWERYEHGGGAALWSPTFNYEQQRARNIFMKPALRADGLSIQLIFRAAELWAKDKGFDDDKMVKLFEGAVRKTQNTLSVIDATEFQEMSPKSVWAAILSTFQAQQQKFFNVGTRLLRRYSRGEITLAAFLGGLTATFIFNSLWNALVEKSMDKLKGKYAKPTRKDLEPGFLTRTGDNLIDNLNFNPILQQGAQVGYWLRQLREGSIPKENDSSLVLEQGAKTAKSAALSAFIAAELAVYSMSDKEQTKLKNKLQQEMKQFAESAIPLTTGIPVYPVAWTYQVFNNRIWQQKDHVRASLDSILNTPVKDREFSFRQHVTDFEDRMIKHGFTVDEIIAMSKTLKSAYMMLLGEKEPKGLKNLGYSRSTMERLKEEWDRNNPK